MKIRTGKDKAWYGITRIQKDGKKSTVYAAAVTRQSLQVRRGFTVSRYGSEEGAFQAAQEWRDRVVALLPPTTYRQLRTLVRRNNTSGHPGIYRVVESSYVCWRAVVNVAGKTQARAFSVKKYGEEGARQMAIEARQQMLQSVPDRLWLATEAALDLTTQTFDNPEALATDNAVVWDEATKERFWERLRAEGLIDQPHVPPVQRRHFASRKEKGPIWQARYFAPSGKKILRQFSVSKYGDEEAERLAWQAYEQLKEEFSPKRPSRTPVRLSEQFDAIPDQLLDASIRRLALKNDAALARRLGIAPPVISKIRHRHLPVGASLLVRLLESTELHIRDLYRLAQGEAAC